MLYHPLFKTAVLLLLLTYTDVRRKSSKLIIKEHIPMHLHFKCFATVFGMPAVIRPVIRAKLIANYDIPLALY